MQTLGKLPAEWWNIWEGRSKYFDESGVAKDECWPFAERFEFCVQEPWTGQGMDAFGEAEEGALCGMLRAILASRPEERLSARGFLESEWMKEWAFPDLQRMKEMQQEEQIQ